MIRWMKCFGFFCVCFFLFPSCLVILVERVRGLMLYRQFIFTWVYLYFVESGFYLSFNMKKSDILIHINISQPIILISQLPVFSCYIRNCFWHNSLIWNSNSSVIVCILLRDLRSQLYAVGTLYKFTYALTH